MIDIADHLVDYVRAVKICHSPYNPDEVQALLQAVQKEFGRNKDRYYWKWALPTTKISAEDVVDWNMEFYFRDPHDAIIFSLKYSK